MSECTCLPYQDGGPCPSCRSESEIDDLRSHVSRLEESLRVALEERAEAVEVLRVVAPALDYCIEELEAFGWLDKDEHVRAARRRLARAIGKGE